MHIAAYYYSHQIKKDEMDRMWNMHGGIEKHTGFSLVNLKVINHLEHVGTKG